METDIQFGIVPKWLLEVASDRAVTMYAWLAATFDIGNEQYAGVDWLAARSGKSKSYVTRAMKELVEIGAVTRRRRMNKSTMTTIHRLPSSQIRRDGEVKFAESGEGKSDALSRPINYPDLVDPEKNTSTLIAEFNVGILGWILTAVLGIGGAFVGGIIARSLWAGENYAAGWIMSIFGAVILLFIVRLIAGKGGAAS